MPVMVSSLTHETAECETGMELYYFLLNTGSAVIPDQQGEELSDAWAARFHAEGVAQEMMRHCEHRTRNWRIQVCDDYLKPLFDISFDEFNPLMLTRPVARLRESIERTERTMVARQNAFIDVRRSLSDVWQTLAEAERVLASLSRQR